MRKLVRPVVIFGTLYFASCLVVQLGLPWLLAWHPGHCRQPSLQCSASATALSYWWLALFPLLGVATLLLNRVASRHAA
jgi:hypothetical protein